MMARVERLRRHLATPVDIAGLVWFRVVLGVVFTWEMFRYLRNDWVTSFYVEREVLLPYWPFTFVRPLPEPWLTAQVVVVAAAGLAVAVGWRFRIASWVLLTGFTWLFLLDQTRYLNHQYLMILLVFVLACLPAHRSASVDARSGLVERSETTPAWTLGWVRFMVAVPYFFGGIAKLHPDWLRGEPMRSWLAGEIDYPLIGPWLDTDWAVLFFVAGGLLFDLLVVPLLLVRRTRVVGLGLMLAFHILNCRMFEIGVFPFMMTLATLVFLPADWPRHVWRDLTSPRLRDRLPLVSGAIVGALIGALHPSQPDPVNAVIVGIGVAVFAWEIARYGWDHDRPMLGDPAPRPIPSRLFAALAVWVGVQVLVPLRHLAFPGDVHWTEEGHRWSWRMKLRDKTAEKGGVFVVDPPGPDQPFEVRPRDHLSHKQVRKVMVTPELTVMFAQRLVELYEVPGAAVYVRAKVSLNGRPPQAMIDPSTDLTQVRVPWIPPAPWILPPAELPARRPVQLEVVEARKGEAE